MNGEMPEDWRRSRLGLHLREPIRNGYSPVCPKEPTGKWMAHLGAVTENGFRAQAVKPAPPDDERVDAARLEPGDLVVSRSNTRERVGLAGIYEGAPTPCSYPDLLMRVRTTPDVDQRYLLCALLSRTGRRYFHRAARGTSGSMVKIDRSLLESFPFALPPLAEQRGIAATLKSVDDATAASEAVVEQLGRVRHDLMAHLLVGPAAAAWPTIRLGDAGEWLSGGTPNKALLELWTGSIPWVSPKDMKRPRIGEAEDHLSEAAATNGTRLVQPGTLLMVVRGMILAHTFPVALTTATVAFNQDIKALRPREGLLPEYLLYWLTAMQPEVLKIVEVANHGTKRLATQRLHDLSLPVPPTDGQQRIVTVLRTVDVRLSTEVAAVTERRRVKAALADALLSGKLRVRDAA